MLIQFNFKNYRSFKDEASLDMSATKITEFSDSVITAGQEKILPVAAIYGANASGKSNVYSAFLDMTKYVVTSFNFGDDKKAFSKFRPKPFMFSAETENSDTLFEVYFTIPGDKKERQYNYGFCIDNEGVTEEWLNSKAKTARNFTPVFYRDSKAGTLDLKGIPKASQDNIKIALEKEVLIISLGAKLKISKCKLIRDWFISNQFTDFANPLTSFFMHSTVPKGFIEDPEVRKEIIKYFSSFDENIKDFRIEEMISESTNSSENSYKISALHKKIDTNDYAEIPLEEESAGTLKMFTLYPKLHQVIKNGGVYFFDELNARLHPLLVRNFIITFLNPEINKNHAQLIFTTHDTWQLSNNLLRRDEIWFTEKDNNGISTLYSLADFVDDDGSKIRKDESYEKNYLLGKYGAVPDLKRISIQTED